MATFITEDGNVYYENVPEEKRALLKNLIDFINEADIKNAVDAWLEDNIKTTEERITFNDEQEIYTVDEVWYMFARKSGNTVQLQLNCALTNVADGSNAFITIGTLPEGYIPDREFFDIITAQSGRLFILNVNTDGDIKLYNISGTAGSTSYYIRFNIAFNINGGD